MIPVENFEDYCSEDVTNGVWKKTCDITEDADVARDPVGFDNARLADFAAHVQTKHVHLQVHTKSLSQTESNPMNRKSIS